jgi:acyl-coenzyme A thioesterase PaaI-like protein
MAESWSTRLTRWGFNLHPTYWCTGGRIRYISADWHEVRVRLSLSWRTRNYVGTVFGGAMYSAVDPFFMIMLIKILGPAYTVWDKAAAIRFRRPARGALDARFVVEPSVVAAIREDLRRSPKVDRVFMVDLVGSDGTVHASVEKTIHVSLADGTGSRGSSVSS